MIKYSKEALRRFFSRTFQKQYNDILTKRASNIVFPNHTAFLGSTTSGKSHLIGTVTEYIVDNGYSKAIFLQCREHSYLEECLTFMFPNDFDDNTVSWIRGIPSTEYSLKEGRTILKKRKPKGFKVKVYVPISKHVPDKLPDNFIPFSIPINDWDETDLQVFYGSSSVSSIKSVYEAEIRNNPKGDSLAFADAKNTFLSLQDKGFSLRPAFMDVEVVSIAPSSKTRTVSGFLDRLRLFDDEGVLSSGNFKYNLHDLLKKELNDQKTIVIVDTHWVENKEIQDFIIAYFISTIVRLQDEGGYKEKNPYKITLIVDDATFMFPTNEEKQGDARAGITARGKNILNTKRHAKMEMWISLQNPHDIDPKFFTNIKTIFVTDFSESKSKEWLQRQPFGNRITKSLISEYFSVAQKMRELYGIYPFIIADAQLEVGVFNQMDKLAWGCKTSPRLSYYATYADQEGKKVLNYKVPIDKNFSALTTPRQRKIGNKTFTLKPLCKLTDEMKKAKLLLAQEVRESNIKLRKTLEHKDTEKRQTSIKKIRDLEEGAKTIAELYNKGIRGITKFQENTGFGREKIRQLIGKARTMGLLNEEETIEAEQEEKEAVAVVAK